ncbi:hypothetical protein SELMODRAFT_111506 [Selaginella moellendorffii]|uniref:glutathione transferase n=1 Tax=Selaginella moellendorffii TaxID=88036 RepID=D8S8Q9_SELML|nr:hypothetical protein SELMODRAFT_111506 [Selaginella moellendorffii]
MASSDQDVTLLSFWASPFSMRAKLALLLKGIEHEDLPEDLGNKSKILLESNPVHKKVPVLIHKGKPIAESAIIVHYIDEVWPGTSPLLPKDAFLRAEHRFWSDFIDKKVCSINLEKSTRSHAFAYAKNEEFSENYELLEGAFTKLGNEEEGPFFGGARMAFLDVMLAPYVVWIPGIVGLKPASQEQCPRLHNFFQAVLAHPAAKLALPTVEALKEFLVARSAVYRGK